MQLSANPHPAHPAVTSHTRRADNHNTHTNVGGERAHRPNRTRTRPHTASAERRHSYVTHLTEDGIDRRFLQEQVGHRCDTSTAIYTHVSGDFMNTALRKAIGPALDAVAGQQ
jgi:site-specific recombinase XerC